MAYRDIDYKPKLIKKNELLGLPVHPSHSIYFDKYAYKIVFDHTIFTNWRQRVNFKRQMEDFDYDLCNGGVRHHVAHNGVRLYLRSYDDLIIALNIFKDQILYVAAPKNAEHVKLMTSKDYFPVLRKRNYYNKYDCKIWISTVVWHAAKSMYQTYPTYRPSTRIDTHEHLEFFVNNIDDIKVRDGFLSNDNEFYCNYEDFVTVLPFYKLQWPDHRLVVRKVLCFDKY